MNYKFKPSDVHVLNSQANRTKLFGAEKLYNLLVNLYDAAAIESRLFEEGSEAEPGIIYMLLNKSNTALLKSISKLPRYHY